MAEGLASGCDALQRPASSLPLGDPDSADAGRQASRQAAWDDLPDTAGGSVDPGHRTSRLEGRVSRRAPNPRSLAVGSHPLGVDVEPNRPKQPVGGRVDPRQAVAALGDPDDAAGDRDAHRTLGGSLITATTRLLAASMRASAPRPVPTHPAPAPTATSDGRKR